MRPENARGRGAYAPGQRHYQHRNEHSWRNDARYARPRPLPDEETHPHYNSHHRASSASQSGSGGRSWHRYPHGRTDVPERKRRRDNTSPPPRQAPFTRFDRSKPLSHDEHRHLPHRQSHGLPVRGSFDRLRHAPPSRWRSTKNDEPVEQAETVANAQEAKPPPPPPPPPPPGPPPAKPRPSRLDSTSSDAASSLDDAYEIVAQVGEGTYGQVYKASAGSSSRLVALKKIRMDNAREGFPVTSMREMKLLQALRHENVIRLHEIMTSRTGSVYMVFEYMEHDLNGLLVHPKVSFTHAHIKSLAQQLLRGLAYLHHRAVLHRDLKGSNLLLNRQGILKIADFGLARTYYKRKTGDYTNRVVTLWYRPPELLLGATQYGAEVDAWGAGCLFLELFQRHAVFQGRDEIHQLQVMTRVLGPLSPDAWPDVQYLPWYELLRLEHKNDATNDTKGTSSVGTFDSDFGDVLTEGALSLARGLLSYDPRKRMSMSDALQCAYFTSEAPTPEPPAELLSSLDGEWHEMQSKLALRHAHHQASKSHQVP